MVMAGMVSVNRIEENQSRFVPVCLNERESPLIIRSIGIVFQETDIVQIFLVIRIDQVRPIVIKGRLYAFLLILQHFENRRIISVAICFYSRKLEFVNRPAVINDPVQFRTASGEMARPVRQSDRRHDHPCFQ